MERYDYGYQPPFAPMCPPEGVYPDRGDGFGEYYDMGPVNDDRGLKRRSRSNPRKAKHRESKRSRSRSRSKSRTSERSQSQSRSQSRSRTRTRSRSRSRSSSRQRDLKLTEPGFLDAFRVLYLTPSKHGKNTTKYLATKKRQDRIQEILKSDGLGSKRWLFYPRTLQSDTVADVSLGRNCDQRIKIDGDFFRKYKKSRKVEKDAPIAKLKRWELIFYKKLGFIQAV